MKNLFRNLLQYPLFCTAILLAGCTDTTSTSSLICNRTEQVVHAILAQIPNVNFCKAVTTAHLKRITALDLHGQAITELQSGDFRGLTNLSELYLDNNQLTTLPDGIFSPLSKLSQLYLGLNLLARLPDNTFSRLSILDLEANKLRSLPEGIFAGLSSLSVLSLFNNRLTSLPAGIFSSLSNLSELHLSANPGYPFNLKALGYQIPQ